MRSELHTIYKLIWGSQGPRGGGGTIFNLSNNLCWRSLDAIWIFSYDKWIGARAALGATYCWNAVDAKK